MNAKRPTPSKDLPVVVLPVTFDRKENPRRASAENTELFKTRSQNGSVHPSTHKKRGFASGKFGSPSPLHAAQSFSYTLRMTSYKEAGVDIDEADAAKRSMKESIDQGDPRVLNTLGAFASLVDGRFPGFNEPVLVLKTEEPGSKQKLAFEHGYIRSICLDTINHLVNDIAVMGAHPQFAQDLILCGKLDKQVVNEIVAGFAEACKAQECVLTGGETTEQPGVLQPGVYALAASIVGVVERSKIIDGSAVQVGDVVLAVASNGLHTNGYTLVRALMAKDPGLMQRPVGERSFLDAVMLPHTCYYMGIRGLFHHPGLHGMAHITGGGIQGNLNRILPQGMDAKINLATIPILDIFRLIREAGAVKDAEMLRTFNMGVGLAMVVAPEAVEEVSAHLNAHGHQCCVIGSIIEGSQQIQFEGDLSW